MEKLIRFNVFQEIRKGRNDLVDAKAVVQLIFFEYKEGDFDHWKRSAYALLVCAILHTLYSGKNKSLARVHDLINMNKRYIANILDLMLLTEHDPYGEFGWLDLKTNLPTKTHPIIASVVREFKKKDAWELSEIFGVAYAYLQLFLDPVCARNTCESDFGMQDLIKRIDK